MPGHLMDHNELVNQLYDQAHSLPPEERADFLRSRCSDERVVQRVLDVFAGLQAAPTILRQPAILSPAGPQEPGGFDAYRIIRELGKGGMGIVYLAEDPELDGRKVALKVMHADLMVSEQARKRFRREAATVARLDHPAIVPVYRYSEREGPQYISMKFIDGLTFSEYCKNLDETQARGEQSEPERERRIARAVQRIAEALHHAHGLGVVHRDVKPSNILVDAGGNSFLSDFGIAKVADEPALTQSQQNPITPAYASPEQVDRDEAQARKEHAQASIDGRSDVFSLGVVLYEALTGFNPFRRETAPETLLAIRTFEPPSVRRSRRSIPRPLATIVTIAIEKDRRFRYPTAAHLATDLGCWIRGEPIFGRRIGWARRMHRWLHRQRGRAAGLGLGLLALLALVLAGIVVLQQRATTAAVHVQASLSGRGSDSHPAVWIARFDPATLELSSFESLGTLPVVFRRPPGQYRLLARVGRDGPFAETSIIILRPGEPQSVQLALIPTEQVIARGMVRFAGGEFQFGSPDRKGFQRRRLVRVAPFSLDETEVTNSEYDVFVRATGHALPEFWACWPGASAGSDLHFDPDLADRPVVGVSWDDAQAYARWRGKRLPTVYEWEFAMRLGSVRTHPWGDGEPQGFPVVPCEDQHRAGISDPVFQYAAYTKFTHPVRAYPGLCTPEGLFGGSDNVQEMTESVSVGPTTVRLIKGAGWHQLWRVVTPVETMTLPFESMKDGTRVRDTSMKVGFRCARSADPWHE